MYIAEMFVFRHARGTMEKTFLMYMTGEQFVSGFYTIVLYGTLGVVSIPVIFFFLWAFFSFWRKHVVLFYVFLFTAYLGSIAGFYFTQKYWIYLYYPFPSWLQICGLMLLVFSSLVVLIAERSITIPVRFFYPLLKGIRFPLHVRGIYKYVRHPMYAVFPWLVLGVFFYTGQLILFPVFLFILVTRTFYANAEESYLKKIFGGDYEKYMKQTPNRFYPKLF
jgi:protein-S-isoprenylcysteine O-methyltransferase Ste14